MASSHVGHGSYFMKKIEMITKIINIFWSTNYQVWFLIDGLLWPGRSKYFGQPDQVFGITKPGIGGNQKQYTR